jgi:hypothetical protein
MEELVNASELHDRVEEWQSLAEFASDTDPGTVQQQGARVRSRYCRRGVRR